MIEVNKCLQFICATLYYILLLFDLIQLTSTTIINMFLFFLGNPMAVGFNKDHSVGHSRITEKGLENDNITCCRS